MTATERELATFGVAEFSVEQLQSIGAVEKPPAEGPQSLVQRIKAKKRAEAAKQATMSKRERRRQYDENLKAMRQQGKL